MARDRDYDVDSGETDTDARHGGEEGPPPNYLVPAILVTFCCCTIAGIVAIVNAAQVNSKWQAGDYAGARQASHRAKMWCWISAAIGVVQPAIIYRQFQLEMNKP